MMADHFVDDEAQEFFGEVGIELCILRQFAQAGNLAIFARGIGSGQAGLRLVTPHCLRHLKPFGEHEDQSRVDIVDALAIMLQLQIGHTDLLTPHLP
jgi:octaprenyl-diphosphate synthase